MSSNPVSLVRTLGSVAIIVISVLAIAVLFLTDAPSTPWVIAIGVTAGGFAVLSFLMSLWYPKASDRAWDEMNRDAHRASLTFGYWAALLVFVGLLTAVDLTDLDARTAFYWMGPVLGLAPIVHFLSSVIRGRAE